MPALIAVMVAAGLGALFVLFWHALEEVERRVTAPEDNIVWALSQLEQEYNRLMLGTVQAQHEASAQAFDAMRLRLDLFVSRIRILQQGTFHRQLLEDAAHADAVARVSAVVPRADAIVAAADPLRPDRAAAAMEDLLEPLREDLRRLTVGANHFYAQLEVEEQRTMRRLILLIAGVFTLLAVGVVGFLGLVGLQQRRLQRSNESLAALSVELKQANQTKSRFLANMSHELRTPLNAVLGFSEIMRDQRFGPLAERYREYAGDIHGSAAHLLALINDVLDLSKVEAGRRELALEPIDPAAEIVATVRLLEPRAAERGIAVRQDVPTAIAPVQADRLALRQILLNLLSNAIKFSHDAGTVVVACRQRDETVELSVSDTGVGIPPADLERVVLPFEQVRNAFTAGDAGTGLGLPLTKGLVELHGGAFELESVVGRGTTVRIVLPKAHHRPEAVAADFRRTA
jgi:signal transduction histidine kinase